MEAEPAPSTLPGPATEYVDPALSRPRLSILHLLAWMSFSAVYLAMLRWRLTENGGVLDWRIGLWSVPAGGFWLGAFLSIAWQLRGLRYPFFGGEWVLVCHGVQYLVTIVLLTAVPLGSAWSGGVSVGVDLLGAALLAVAFVALKRPLRWRLALAVLVVENLLEVVVDWLTGVSTLDGRIWLVTQSGLRMIVVGVTLTVTLIDWRRRLRLPWTHWLGPLLVAVTGALTLMSTIEMLVRYEW